MPFSLQAKLLRVLQEREFHALVFRIDARGRPCDRRHQRQLDETCGARQVPQDLVLPFKRRAIHLPTLRERVEDITDLVPHFIEKSAATKQIR